MIMSGTSLCRIMLFLLIILLFGCDDSVSPNGLLKLRGMKTKDFFREENDIALCEAVQSGRSDEIARMVAMGSNPNCLGRDGMRPLLWAVVKNNYEGFSSLLESGANPNFAIDSRQSSGGPKTLVALTIKLQDHRFLSEALRHGGDPNTNTGYIGETIIFDAISFGTNDRLSDLISSGADVNHRDDKGDTPANYAANINNYDMVLQLLDAGADLTIKNKWGESVLDKISIYGDRAMDSDSKYMRDYLNVVRKLRSKGMLMNLDPAKYDGNPST